MTEWHGGKGSRDRTKDRDKFNESFENDTPFYYINLDKSKDRNKHMIDMFNKYNITMKNKYLN